MSGEDDTFDLDIYGDEENQQQQQESENPEDTIDFGDDSYDQNGNTDDGQQDRSQSAAGQKRKAPDDGHDDHQQTSTPTGPRPTSSTSGKIDPNATQALKLSDLNWWNTEEDLRQFCATSGVEAQLVDIAFGEHKINGKSRGEAYMEFDSAAAASAVKHAIEAKPEDSVKQDGGVRKTGLAKARVWYVDHRQGNPFKGRDSGQATKKDAGAYNSAPVRGGFQAGRGGFQDRGRGGFQRGGFQGRGGYQQNQNAQAFGMNGGGYGNAGYGGQMGGMGMMGNPIMAMGMNGMGFRGGFNAMGGNMMAGRGNFNPRGAGYGMGGAGFRGGFQGNQGFQQQQQQQQQGGFQQQQQQGYGMQAGANKRPRQE